MLFTDGVGFFTARIKRKCLFVIITALFCSSSWAELQIKKAYVRGLPPGQSVTAAFMHLHNTGDKPLEIVAVSTDSAKSAEIHQHVHNKGMMRMEKVDSVVIPAKGKIVMEPGGYHLMLLNLHKPLREEDTVKIQLTAKNGYSITAQLPVRSVLNEHKHH